MTPLFADTHFYLALLNLDDDHHGAALEFAKGSYRLIVTSAWVLTEMADGMAEPPLRKLAVKLIEDLQSDPGVVVVENDAELFAKAWNLYKHRTDKGWSLTDCTSMVIMKERKLTEVLTHDHHFAQAGFKVLL